MGASVTNCSAGISITSSQRVNIVSSSFSYNGYGLRASNSILNLFDSVFLNNRANGILVQDSSTLLMTGCRAAYNGIISTTHGGGVTIIDSNFKGSYSSFHYNYASSGGALYGRRSIVQVDNMDISNNNAYYGAAFFLEQSSTFTITSSIVNNNNAQSDGGAGVLNNCRSSIKDSSFFRNGAGGRGGAILATESKHEIINCNFTFNYGLDGGALYSSVNSLFTLSRGLIGSNKAVSGGGIFFDRTTGSLSNVEINQNRANASLGGGIYLSESHISMNYITCTSNTAYFGGCVAVSTWSHLSISHSFISKNYSPKRGAGVYSYGGSVDIERAIITNNYGSNYGGGVSAFEGATLSVSNCLLQGNVATQGGGVYSLRSQGTFFLFLFILLSFFYNWEILILLFLVKISGTRVIENEAAIGGGVHVNSSTIFLIFNTTISFNNILNQ